MKHKQLFLFVFLVFVFSTNAQPFKSKYLLKSAITSVNSKIVFNSDDYSVQQSTGQSSIVGKKNISGFSVQQGYLNYFFNFKIDNSVDFSIDENLKFSISPNPFIDFVKIDFSVPTKEDIFIKVYDMNGKVFLIQKFPPSAFITIPLSNLSIGNYLIHIKTGLLNSTKKILKPE